MDKLINDNDSSVRQTVACQGYGLDKLIDDKDKWVSAIARTNLKQMGFQNINDWITKNPDKCALRENQGKSNEKIDKNKIEDSIKPSKSVCSRNPEIGAR